MSSSFRKVGSHSSNENRYNQNQNGTRSPSQYRPPGLQVAPHNSLSFLSGEKTELACTTPVKGTASPIGNNRNAGNRRRSLEPSLRPLHFFDQERERSAECSSPPGCQVAIHDSLLLKSGERSFQTGKGRPFAPPEIAKTELVYSTPIKRSASPISNSKNPGNKRPSAESASQPLHFFDGERDKHAEYNPSSHSHYRPPGCQVATHDLPSLKSGERSFQTWKGRPSAPPEGAKVESVYTTPIKRSASPISNSKNPGNKRPSAESSLHPLPFFDGEREKSAEYNPTSHLHYHPPGRQVVAHDSLSLKSSERSLQTGKSRASAPPEGTKAELVYTTPIKRSGSPISSSKNTGNKRPSAASFLRALPFVDGERERSAECSSASHISRHSNNTSEGHQSNSLASSPSRTMASLPHSTPRNRRISMGHIETGFYKFGQTTTAFNEAAQFYPHVENFDFDLEVNPSFWKDRNVQVLIRQRPLNSAEIALHGYGRCLRQESPQTLSWLGQPETRFTFDHAASEKISQEKLFKVVGLPMVENCIAGYNSCMFAYGQTGSGKTYTMMGDIEEVQQLRENCGLTPRIFEYLFEKIQMEEAQSHEHLQFTCKCSFLEIYNEQIIDLLEPMSTNLQIREDPKTGIFVEDLSVIEVKDVRDVFQLLIQGSANRKVAATIMNQESSRSHSVFTCVIESQWESDSVVNTRFGRLNLVDLAGSERQKYSATEGERLKEAVNINKSLSTLGLVIMTLVDIADGKQRHVPYRDSKLTFLLQDSLGGNSKTTIIATVSPSISCANETLSTLKFAQRAKFIQNNAVVNENASGDVMALRSQIHQLKEELLQLQSQNALLMPSSNIGRNDECEVDVLKEKCSSLPHDSDDKKDEQCANCSKKLSNLEAVMKGALRREQAAKSETKQLSDYIEKLQNMVEEQEGEIKRLQLLANGSSSKDSSIFENKVRLGKRLRISPEGLMQELQLDTKRTNLQQELKSFQKFQDAKEQKLLLDEIASLREQVICLIEEKAKYKQDPTTTVQGMEMGSKAWTASSPNDKLQPNCGTEVGEKELKPCKPLMQNQNPCSSSSNTEQITDGTLQLICKNKDPVFKRLANRYEIKLSQRDDQIHNLTTEWEGATTALIDYLDEGNQALDDATHELEGILDYPLPEGLKKSYLGGSDVLVEEREKNTNLNKMIHHAYRLVKTAEGRVTSLCRITAPLLHESNECKMDISEEGLVACEEDSNATQHMIHGDISERVKQDKMQSTTHGEARKEKVVASLRSDQEETLKKFTEVEARSEQMRSMVEKLVKEIEEKDATLMSVRGELEEALANLQDVQFDAESEGQVCGKHGERSQYLELLASQLEHAHQDINEKQRKIEEMESEMEKVIQFLKDKVTRVKQEKHGSLPSEASEVVLRNFQQGRESLKEAGIESVHESASLSFETHIIKLLHDYINIEEKDDTILNYECIIDSLEQKIKSIFIRMADQPIAEELCTLFADQFRSILLNVEDNVVSLQQYAENAWERVERVTEENKELEKELERNQELLRGSLFDLSLLQERIAGSENSRNELTEAKTSIKELQHDLEKTSMQCASLRHKNRDLQRSLIRKSKDIDKLDYDMLDITEQATLLERENTTLRGELEQAVKRSLILEEQLKDNKCIIEALETDLFQMRSYVEQKMVRSVDEINHRMGSIVKERDQLHEKLFLISKELETTKAIAKKNMALATEAQQATETNKQRVGEKEKEARLLEQSVVVLESTVAALESQVNVLKSESEEQRLSREDLEMELQELRHRMSEIRADYSTMETTDSGAPMSFKAAEHQALQAQKEVKHLVKILKEKDTQIDAYRVCFAELTTAAQRQAAENYQKLHDLEVKVEKMKSGRAVPEKEINKNSNKEDNKGLKRSGSPFRCINSGLVHQMHYDINKELCSSKQRMEELQDLVDSQQKEILLLRTRLAEAECMTRDVIRDLLEVKLDITSCATWLDQKQVEKILKENLTKDQELKALQLQFVEEKESWLERNKRRQAEAVAAQIKAEKLRLKEKMLGAENKRLKMEISGQKKEVAELQGEIQRLAKTAGVSDACLHSHLQAKPNTEDLRSRLKNTKDLLNYLTNQLSNQAPINFEGKSGNGSASEENS